MTSVEEEDDDPFPADDCLFGDTFHKDSVYTLIGEELKIRQVFGANLGVAAPVWEAVRADHIVFNNMNVTLLKLQFVQLCVFVCVHRRCICVATSRSSPWS